MKGGKMTRPKKKKNIKKTLKQVKNKLEKVKSDLTTGLKDIQDQLENFDPLKDWDMDSECKI